MFFKPAGYTTTSKNSEVKPWILGDYDVLMLVHQLLSSSEGC